MQLQVKKVLIFGASRSGISALKIARQQGIEVSLVDQNPIEHNPRKKEIFDFIGEEDIWLEQNFPMHLCSQYDQVVISPGISRNHPLIGIFISKGIEVIGEIEFAYRSIFSFVSRDNRKLIAVTGTNGKTTTVSFVTHALKQLGCSVFLGGNIGIPFSDYYLDTCSEEIIVLELSSFQLESLKDFASDYSAITNITLSHTERYTNLEEYKTAKYNIFKNKNQISIALLPKSLTNDIQKFENLVLFDKKEILSFQKKYEVTQKRLDDFGFWEDLYLGAQIVKRLLEDTDKTLEVDWARIILSFHGVEHRNEIVPHDLGPIQIINNSKSTNFVSTTLFLKFRKKPVDLIMGGQLRDNSSGQGKELIPYKKRINRVYLYGESASALKKSLEKDFTVFQFKTLDELIPHILGQELTHDLLFSPCYPSFDQFLNFEQRGKHFKKLVQNFVL